jgi:hypothetical protein
MTPLRMVSMALVSAVIGAGVGVAVALAWAVL